MPDDVTPAPDDSPPTPPANPPAAPASPPGTVQLTEAEFNRLQADARTARKKADKLESDRRDREESERLEAQRAAGEFDTALREKDEKATALKRQLELRDTRDALRDRISALGFAGSKAAGLLKLVTAEAIPVVDGVPDLAAVEAEVDATIASYPDLFDLTTDGGGDPASDEEKPRMRRNQRPPAAPDAASDHPADYVSPEEYTKTPHRVRHTPEFQARVAKSRAYWPKKIPARSFAVDQ